jgi:hypothetical protein
MITAPIGRLGRGLDRRGGSPSEDLRPPASPRRCHHLAQAFRNGESWGRATLWWLVQTLNLDYVEKTYTSDDGTSRTGYVWPAAQDTPLAEIPADQRAALEALYPRPLSEYGYRTGDLDPIFSGFHVSITPDGTWTWLGSNTC